MHVCVCAASECSVVRIEKSVLPFLSSSLLFFKPWSKYSLGKQFLVGPGFPGRCQGSPALLCLLHISAVH